MKKRIKGKSIKIVGILFLIIVISLNAAFPLINTFLERNLGDVYARPDKAELQSYLEQGTQLAKQVEAEGTVMVKNDNQALPLVKENNKVNVFGWSSTDWLGGGSGSGQVRDVDTDFLSALEQYGISYNRELSDMYESFLDARPYKRSLAATTQQICRLYEPLITDQAYYSDKILEDAKLYSDTAIVVLSRYAGESIDCPRVQYKVSELTDNKVRDGKVVVDEDRTYLEISSEEEQLLKYVGKTYDKVIVLINSTNTMELGFLDTISGLDACLVTGASGVDAASAIPEILYGDISPSGKLTDTYAYDLETSAAYANAGAEGEGEYSNAEDMYPANNVTNNNAGNFSDYQGVHFLDYVEGIYIGYKWYETADAEDFWKDVSNEYGTGYQGVVQYPFGYGLSYTTFSWKIVDALPLNGSELQKSGMIQVTVQVTNTGKVSGKDVVEAYATTPYYAGQIEKSSEELVGFAKTTELQPGESENVTISFQVRSMASYDCYDANDNEFAGYELDPGEYQIRLMTDAHHIKDSENILTYSIQNDICYETDSETGKTIENRFTGSSAAEGIAIDGSDSDADIVYLSRANFARTFPYRRDADRIMADQIKELNLYQEQDAEDWIDSSDEPVTMGFENGLRIYDKNGYTKLAYRLGLDYYAQEWDELLDQMSQKEMERLVLHAYSKTEEAPTVGKVQSQDYDGPSQVGGYVSTTGEYTGFPNETVIASTWNVDLAYQMGYIEGLQAGQQGIEGWYAPAANIHRTPLGGRNYEYYSEDSYLSGMMAARTIEGAKNTGMYCYMKHLVCNEQETNRDGLYTWMTEQALREVYLKPFRIAIQKGKASGIMTSYNRIGATWAGGSSALLTKIIRGEMGFQGTIITDYSDHHQYMNMDQALRAGGDLWMDGVLEGDFQYETSSASYQQALRRAVKNILYTSVNAAAVNRSYVNSSGEDIMRPFENETISIWRAVLYILDFITVILLFLWIKNGVLKKNLDK